MCTKIISKYPNKQREVMEMREIRTAALIGMGAMGAVFAPGLSATLGDGFGWWPAARGRPGWPGASR